MLLHILIKLARAAARILKPIDQTSTRLNDLKLFLFFRLCEMLITYIFILVMVIVRIV